MLALLLILGGCDADCSHPERLNGTYAVFHTVLNASGESASGDTADTGDDAAKAEGGGGQATATDYDGLTYAVFVNGWSKWELTWASSTGQLKAATSDAKERMGDPGNVTGAKATWSGEMAESADNCNVFELTLRGQFTTSEATEHLFTYTADLVWEGEGLAGTYVYSDTFSGPTAAGGLSNARGEVLFVTQEGGGFDTGF
jgi:hypothetical protein